ncbi:hypothetical protein EST38_g10277 [Candolleomyces aberdarensis]|uniref:Uncharacterized protein n=1 Tax=Candolleomyces aberdarensis TaxID=2316362 RepID=A0A4Q2D9G8_9AGAR|nr:hypothetical protein EST38_g10277 [Candolleomyces aberdarensis]
MPQSSPTAQTEGHPVVLPFADVENIPHVLQRSSWKSWHPKVTAYRLMLSAVTLGLGTSKALASASKTSQSSVSITIEWVGGIIFLLLFFFLNEYEAKNTARPYWVFKADIMDGVRNLLRDHLGINIPQYDTEERDLELLLKPETLPMTGYRIIVTASAISFGITKAALAYHGFESAPTTVEWIYAIVVTLGLYWLGFYEASTNEVMPWLFSNDYSHQGLSKSSSYLDA